MLKILVIIYIDSRLLYNCLVRLSIIDKKRLIINIILLQDIVFYIASVINFS